MRGFRRLSIFAVVVFLILAFQPYAGTLFASHQTLFFRSNARGGFQPVGIDFNFRLSEPAQENVTRMLVTRPLSGNPRELQQRDADGSSFSLRITLPKRPPNTPFVDSVAAIPDALGQTLTEGGFTPNDILVSQGLTVYKVSGAEAALPLATPPPVFATITGSTCTSGNSDLLIDRWGIQFRGEAILTCQGSSGLEIWLIASTGTATPLITDTLPGTYSGRADITSPNFQECGGCLAIVADGSSTLKLIGRDQITGLPIVSDLAVGALSSLTGKRLVLTVPPRVFRFGQVSSAQPEPGCLFGTIPADNAINKFPCGTYPDGASYPLNVFNDTANGDLLIFTPSGAPAGTVVRVRSVVPDPPLTRVGQVDTGVGTYEDLAFPSLRLVGLVVQQPAVSNPNLGVQGHIVFYIVGGPGFNPQTDVDISSVRFGATGNEDSVMGNCVAVGKDINGDGFPDLKCSAVQAVAMCDEVTIQCIVTGFTINPTGFEGE